MVSRGFGWVSQPKRPTFACTRDYIDFAEKHFPRALITETVVFCQRVSDHPIPKQHCLTGMRELDVLFWNRGTRGWINVACRSNHYRKLLPGFKSHEVFEVVVKSLSAIVQARLQSQGSDE